MPLVFQKFRDLFGIGCPGYDNFNGSGCISIDTRPVFSLAELFLKFLHPLVLGNNVIKTKVKPGGCNTNQDKNNN